MANITAKTSSNAFYQARCAAAAHNDQLSSREGAADIMSIERGRLYRIERGLVNPYPEEVHLMADLYNTPELRNRYCTGICPLGCDITGLVQSSGKNYAGCGECRLKTGLQWN